MTDFIIGWLTGQSLSAVGRSGSGAVYAKVSVLGWCVGFWRSRGKSVVVFIGSFINALVVIWLNIGGRNSMLLAFLG